MGKGRENEGMSRVMEVEDQGHDKTIIKTDIMALTIEKNRSRNCNKGSKTRI